MLLQHYRQARHELLEVIDGLTDEQLAEQSLDGWSVKDHLAHLALWDDVRASEVERIFRGTRLRMARMTRRTGPGPQRDGLCAAPEFIG